MQCHAIIWKSCNISHFSSLCVCTCACVCVCVQMRKRGKKIWWIVSYMASISRPVIYGVNNWVYSHACSPVVFLFVAGWQKYYSQTTHLLYPILIQKPINWASVASVLFGSMAGTMCTYVPAYVAIVALFAFALILQIRQTQLHTQNHISNPSLCPVFL